MALHVSDAEEETAGHLLHGGPDKQVVHWTGGAAEVLQQRRVRVEQRQVFMEEDGLFDKVRGDDADSQEAVEEDEEESLFLQSDPFVQKHG